MKKLMLYVLTSVLMLSLAGCIDEPSEYIRYEKVVPDSLKEKAMNKMIEILQTVKVQSRTDDEDMEDWIAEARRTVIDIYGVETVGITFTRSWQFVPYNRLNETQKTKIDKWLAEER